MIKSVSRAFVRAGIWNGAIKTTDSKAFANLFSNTPLFSDVTKMSGTNGATDSNSFNVLTNHSSSGSKNTADVIALFTYRPLRSDPNLVTLSTPLYRQRTLIFLLIFDLLQSQVQERHFLPVLTYQIYCSRHHYTA